MRYRYIAVSSLGNILEWLDFGLFLFLAPIIGGLFFPAENPALSQLAAFGVFAGGFLCRPLGGIIFGHFGDKYSRAHPLRFSIILISVSTVCIGLLPTYTTLGIVAPILFTLLRLVQGIAIGGEYSGVMTYLVESAPKKQRGFVGSFAATGANLGFFLATLLVLCLQHYFTSAALAHGIWRAPFLCIGGIGAWIAYYRLQLLETPVYTQVQVKQQIIAQPLLHALRTTPKNLGIIFGLNAMSCGFYYVFFGYMPEYLQHYVHLSAASAFRSELYTLVGLLCLVPVMGMLGDHYGRKKILLLTASGMLLFAFPLFLFLQYAGGFFITLALGIATLLSAMDQGNTLTTAVETCPPNIRYSSIAFAYNLSSALFGGFSPLIVITLIHYGGLLAPGGYILLTAVLGIVAVCALPKAQETKAKI